MQQSQLCEKARFTYKTARPPNSAKSGQIGMRPRWLERASKMLQVSSRQHGQKMCACGCILEEGPPVKDLGIFWQVAILRPSHQLDAALALAWCATRLMILVGSKELQPLGMPAWLLATMLCSRQLGVVLHMQGPHTTTSTPHHCQGHLM